MNRGRGLSGVDSYARELGLDVETWLRARPAPRWLDLCCGEGAALLAASTFCEPHGVDLVAPRSVAPVHVGTLPDDMPDGPFDLITCVHGLHYIGDKLRVLAEAVERLAPDGLLIAHLDPQDLVDASGETLRGVAAWLGRAPLSFSRGTRRVRCEGRARLELPWTYVGARDDGSTNFTGQRSIRSVYRR